MTKILQNMRYMKVSLLGETTGEQEMEFGKDEDSRSTPNPNQIELMTYQQFRRITEVFDGNMEKEYKRALSEHVTIKLSLYLLINQYSFGNVPYYFWILLVYFMYDDVWQWFKSPYFMAFVILLAGAYGIC